MRPHHDITVLWHFWYSLNSWHQCLSADWQASVSPIRVCVCHCRVYDCMLGGCRVEKLGFGCEELFSRDYCGGRHWCQRAHWLVLPPRKLLVNDIQLERQHALGLIMLAAILQGVGQCFGVFCSPIIFNKLHGKTSHKCKLWNCSVAPELGNNSVVTIKQRNMLVNRLLVLLNLTKQMFWLHNRFLVLFLKLHSKTLVLNINFHHKLPLSSLHLWEDSI